MAASTQRREFLRVQVGAETTPGTRVDATTILASLTDIRYRPDTVVQQAMKLNGSLAVADNADVLGIGGMLQIGGYLSFEDILFLLEMGYKTATPTGDGGTPNIAYERKYRPTLTSADQPKTFSLEAGTNLEAFSMPYGFVESFEFSGRIRDYTNFTASLRAQNYVERAFTAALLKRTVSRVLAQNWEFYLDDADLGAMGATRITDCVVDFTFRSGPLYAWANCLNGSLLPEQAIQQGQRPELTLTLQLGDFSLQLLRDYQAGRKKYIRLRNYGPNIHGTGVATAPAAALAAAVGVAGDLTGDYMWKFTYVYADGTETLPSPAMAAAVTFADEKANLTLITTGGAGVVARRIYRTTAGGAIYKFLTQINNNTATTYTDNAPDDALGVNAPTAATAYTGDLTKKSLTVDLCANILQFPDTGQSVGEQALTVPIVFSGTEDIAGVWGKLVEYTVVNRLATIP